MTSIGSSQGGRDVSPCVYKGRAASHLLLINSMAATVMQASASHPLASPAV